MSNRQTQLRANKDEQKEETYVLLRQQYTAFLEAHKVLQEHLDESTTTEEVLWNWYTYYGQVFQQDRKTREHIKSLENQQGMEEAMRSTIQNQIVLKTTKLEKLEKQAHQWMNQALPILDTLDKICPRMKRLLDTAEEKTQLLGIDMINITDLPI